MEGGRGCLVLLFDEGEDVLCFSWIAGVVESNNQRHSNKKMSLVEALFE